MSEPFLGQIKIFGFNFAPRSWATCDGQLLSINQNQSLFSILGTTYGGDGETSFALPDLRGRLPVQTEGASPLGQRAGQESVSITPQQMGQHDHSVRGSSTEAGAAPAGKVLGTSAGGGRGSLTAYLVPPNQSNQVAIESTTIGMTGAGAGHDNMQPSLVLNFCIALQGLFPSRN